MNALVLPILTKVNSNTTLANFKYIFGMDFGITNSHVAYVKTTHGVPFGHQNIQAFAYDENAPQMVMFNNKQGTSEFGAFSTAVKRELVPRAIGKQCSVSFPMRTAMYQVTGMPAVLEMFSNTNVGFNYGDDISRSKDYKTNIKWDRDPPFTN